MVTSQCLFLPISFLSQLCLNSLRNVASMHKFFDYLRLSYKLPEEYNRITKKRNGHSQQLGLCPLAEDFDPVVFVLYVVLVEVNPNFKFPKYFLLIQDKIHQLQKVWCTITCN